MKREHGAWMPILATAAERMGSRAATSLVLGPLDPLYRSVAEMVPWEIARIQLYKNPKTRRVPVNIEVPFHHRGAALWHHDESVSIESEPIAAMSAVAGRFDRPVKLAIFIYGTAP
eukprot:15441491-Alexandrium_andersonii.AAC.1